jgi:hypothetical protein
MVTVADSATSKEREDFATEHLADTEKAKKLGETLVLILDRLDDMEKPQMIAQVFAAFIRGKISFEVFRRLASAIDMGTIDDLKEFVKAEPRIPHQVGQVGQLSVKMQTFRTNLVRTGLVSLPRYSQTTPITGVWFEDNDLGKIFREIINEAPHHTRPEEDGQNSQVR